MNEQCDNCGLNTEQHPIELQLTPCGLYLCGDCVVEHYHCSGCAREMVYEHTDWEYSRWRDE